MKNKGFTLIELLAVIVILAIIALIATPIILGIINDAREESNQRSVELYANAVRNASSKYQLHNKKVVYGNFTTDDGKLLVLEENSKITLNVEYTGKVLCDEIELYSDGTMYLGKCKVNNSSKKYSYGTRKYVKLDSICTAATSGYGGSVPKGNYTPGDAYKCKVDPNKPEYVFFILKREGDLVHLIMNSNINSDGDATGVGVRNDLVPWIDSNTYKKAGGEDLSGDDSCSSYPYVCFKTNLGPLTAMNHLQKATANWTNTSYLNEKYDDVGGKYKDFEIKGYARLPKLSEIEAANCVSTFCRTNLEPFSNGASIFGRGYWLMDSGGVNSAMTVDFFSAPYDYRISSYIANNDHLTNGGYFGVRPVITLSL